MDKKPLQLLIAEEDNILVQKFFKRKRKVEKLKYEFAGGLIKSFVVSYVPAENAIVLFIEQVPKPKGK